MHADDQTGSEQESHHSPNESEQEPSSLLDLLTALVILTRQTWRDRAALLRAEAKLAVHSLGLMAVLLIVLAVSLVLLWALLLLGAGYLALTLGASPGWIIGAACVAQVLMVVYLRSQVRYLLRWLRFPETRHAFSRLREESAAGKEGSAAGDKSTAASGTGGTEQ